MKNDTIKSSVCFERLKFRSPFAGSWLSVRLSLGFLSSSGLETLLVSNLRADVFAPLWLFNSLKKSFWCLYEKQTERITVISVIPTQGA